LVKLGLPDQIKLSLELMRLFGLYTAEGRGTNCLEMVFGAHEDDLVVEVAELMEKVFGTGVGQPKIKMTETNSIKVKYYSAHLGRFFAKWCGNGSHNMHIPGFLWEQSEEMFLAYLKGYSDGDGYTTKSGKLCCSSVSRQLILELAWLCAMHGIKAGIKYEVMKGGRVIGRKPLPESRVWSLIIGKTSNPFWEKEVEQKNQIKRAIVKKISKKPYDGYVYDFCDVENEAFFGGEKPILLHNSRVRDLFATAKKAGRAIIFIDEIDAIGRARGYGVGGGHDEREQTLNQILVEMDGFEPNTTVIVLAATNRGDLLDSALLRPGRFDRRVSLEMPDIKDREAILKIHAKGKPFVPKLSWKKVAKRTVGFSGADIENMLNEAAIGAARARRKAIEMQDIEESALKVKLGPEKKRLQTDNDRKITAYHEAGHAVVSQSLPGMDPVHRISIVSRGMALGFTLIPPKRERIHETKSHLLNQIASLLGGRAAEEMVFKEMTTGAASDIIQATQLARAMVVEWGMSKLGPVNWGPQMESADWGQYQIPGQASEGQKEKIDKEVQRIVDEGHRKARSVLNMEKIRLARVAEELLKKETLEQEEFERLMK